MIRVVTESGATYVLRQTKNSLHNITRAGPVARVGREYDDMVVIQLELGAPARFVSDKPGQGNITTTKVVSITWSK